MRPEPRSHFLENIEGLEQRPKTLKIILGPLTCPSKQLQAIRSVFSNLGDIGLISKLQITWPKLGRKNKRVYVRHRALAPERYFLSVSLPSSSSGLLFLHPQSSAEKRTGDCKRQQTSLLLQ